MTRTTPPGGDLDAQLFDLAPTSLWLQDLGALRACLEAWRAAGMTDLRDRLRDPVHLATCQGLIRSAAPSSWPCCRRPAPTMWSP